MRLTSSEIPKDELIVTSQEAEGRVERFDFENGLSAELKFGKKGKPASFSVFGNMHETLYYVNLAACEQFVNQHGLPQREFLRDVFEEGLKVATALEQERFSRLGKMAEA